MSIYENMRMEALQKEVKSQFGPNNTRFKCNPVEARELVARALTSRMYHQGEKLLKHCDEWGALTYCCFGVALEVFCANEHNIPQWSNTSGDGCYTFEFDGHDADLPPEVQEWLGFAHSMGKFIDDCNHQTSLTELNDNGTSFDEIAEIFRNPPSSLLAQVC